MAQAVRATTLATLNRHSEDCGNSRVITEDTPITELGLDSLALIEVLYELEETFGVTVDADLLSALNSVGDLVQAIASRQRAAT